MKKISLILLAIFTISCSSDSGDDGYGQNNNDSNNNNNQSSDTSYTVSVTSSGMNDYTLSGKDRNGSVSGNDPSLKFEVGDEITFSVNANGHPFYLKTQAWTWTSNQISGISNNGTTNGNIKWTPSSSGTFYYVCSLHSNMYGMITIVD